MKRASGPFPSRQPFTQNTANSYAKTSRWTLSIRLTLDRRDTAAGYAELLFQHVIQGRVIGRHANHFETLLRKFLGLLAARGIDAALLARLPARGERLCDGVLEFRGDDAVENGVANVVSCARLEGSLTKTWACDSAGVRVPRSKGPMKRTSMPSTAAISFTASRASRVSIWTMVKRASLACCRYSVKVGMGWKRSALRGEPKPRRPTGGNLAAWTSSLACSTVRSNGTRTCNRISAHTRQANPFVSE